MGLGFDMLDLELAVDVATHCVTGGRLILVIHVGGGGELSSMMSDQLASPNCA